ncbi:uncharacterized protein METZ01_LOCUS87326 [marine metagenome]|uniref:Uncharacterized protein n=1 Tax=marine metagenome TaxID=408172 RepID=A0A381V285_9ZZZZ
MKLSVGFTSRAPTEFGFGGMRRGFSGIDGLVSLKGEDCEGL